jgi:hypothetical protein
VAKTAAQWRYILSFLQDLPLAEVGAEVATGFAKLAQQVSTEGLNAPSLNPKSFNPKLLKRWMGPGRWMLVTSGAVAMLFWNGRLVVATGIGVMVMALIYLMQDWRDGMPKALLKPLLTLLNQPLVLAVAGGGTAMLTTYLAASVWADSTSPWIAAGSLVQGAGTLAVLLLLAGQVVQRQGRQSASLHPLLMDLTHADPLRRLIAVRQLMRSSADWETDPVQRGEVVEYFRLMLSRESEETVHEALLDALSALDRQRPIDLRKRAHRPVAPRSMDTRRSLTASPQRPVSFGSGAVASSGRAALANAFSADAFSSNGLSVSSRSGDAVPLEMDLVDGRLAEPVLVDEPLRGRMQEGDRATTAPSVMARQALDWPDPQP